MIKTYILFHLIEIPVNFARLKNFTCLIIYLLYNFIEIMNLLIAFF